MKKLKLYFSTFSLLITCSILLFYTPIKVAKKAANKNKPYILVVPDLVTGFEYKMIYDSATSIDTNENIHIFGEFPRVTNFSDDLYYVENRNTLVCYGEFSPELASPFGVSGRVFVAEGWDILYPIQRRNEIISFYDRLFLTKYDLKKESKP